MRWLRDLHFLEDLVLPGAIWAAIILVGVNHYRAKSAKREAAPALRHPSAPGGVNGAIGADQGRRPTGPRPDASEDTTRKDAPR